MPTEARPTETKINPIVISTNVPVDAKTYVAVESRHSSITALLASGEAIPGSNVVDLDNNIAYRIETDNDNPAIKKALIENNVKVGTNRLYSRYIDIPSDVRWPGLTVYDEDNNRTYEFIYGISDLSATRKFNGKYESVSVTGSININKEYNLQLVDTSVSGADVTVTIDSNLYPGQEYKFKKIDSDANDVIIKDNVNATIATLSNIGDIIIIVDDCDESDEEGLRSINLITL